MVIVFLITLHPLLVFLVIISQLWRISDFVNEAIFDLLITNRIFESEVLPHNVNSLSVSVQSSGTLGL